MRIALHATRLGLVTSLFATALALGGGGCGGSEPTASPGEGGGEEERDGATPASPDEARDAAAADGQQGGGSADGGVVRGPQYGVAGPACRADGWCWEMPRSGGELINAVWGIAPNDVWFAGAAGQLGHFDGYETRAFPTPFSKALHVLSGTATNDVWAGGEGTLLHFDGATWREAQALPGKLIVGLHVDSPSHGWALATNEQLLQGRVYELADGKLTERASPVVTWAALSGSKDETVVVGSCGQVAWGKGSVLDLSNGGAAPGPCNGARYRTVSLGADGRAFALDDAGAAYQLERGKAAVRLPDLPPPPMPFTFVTLSDSVITAGPDGPVVLRKEASNLNNTFAPKPASVLYTLESGAWKRGRRVPRHGGQLAFGQTFGFVGKSLFVTSTSGSALRIENGAAYPAAGLDVFDSFLEILPASGAAPALAIGDEGTVLERSAGGTWGIKERYRPAVATPYSGAIAAARRPDGTLAVFTDDAWVARPAGGAWKPFAPVVVPKRPEGGLFVDSSGTAFVGTTSPGLTVVDATQQRTMPFAEWPGALSLCVEDESHAWAWGSSISTGAVFHYEGGTWSLAAQMTSIKGIVCAPGGNAWLYRSISPSGGGDDVMHWEGGAFTSRPVIANNYLVRGLQPGPAGGLIAWITTGAGGTQRPYYKFTGGVWSEVPAASAVFGPTWQRSGSFAARGAGQMVLAGYSAGAILYHP